MLDILHQLVAFKLHFSVFEGVGSQVVVSGSLVLFHVALQCLTLLLHSSLLMGCSKKMMHKS